MLVRLARFIQGNASTVVATWMVLALVVWIPAPSLPALLRDDAHGFLPPDTLSQQAFTALRDEFPDAAPASRAVVIVARDEGLTDTDHRFLATVAKRLTGRTAELGWRVHAVELAAHLAPILRAADDRAELLAVDLPAPMLTPHTVARVREVHAAIRDAERIEPPEPGLQVEVTGDAALGELLDANARGDVDHTTWWVFGGVIAILLLIYRSPVAMLIPIVTIVLSLMLSLGMIGWGASRGLPVNGLVEMFAIVIVVGCGVDYCLFLFARFREEMARCPTLADAMERALGHAGRPVLASAATNVIGLAVLLLGRNRDLFVSGPCIAFALVIATLAVLTLAPALLQLVGRRLFWPLRVDRATRDGAFWRWIGRTAAARPRTVAGLVLLLLTPPALFGTRVEPLFDALAEYPADSSFVRGANLYYDRFHAGHEVSEPTLLIRASRDLRAPHAQAALVEALDAVAAMLERDFPLVSIRDLTDPLGTRRRSFAQAPSSGPPELLSAWTNQLAGGFYLGRSGASTRVDLVLGLPPRANAAMDGLGALRASVESIVRDRLSATLGPTQVEVLVAGETATYADIRALQHRDFLVIAVTAAALILGILLVLVRSPAQACVLVVATLIAYLSTYGATAWIMQAFCGLPGLSYQVRFLLFVVMLSLGQDYNIFVVSRIREEMRVRPPRSAVAFAVQHTGKVVSGCGLIMAAAFASLLAGSLTVLKEFAVALSLGILVDTFLIRPLLVPSMILLLSRLPGRAPRRVLDTAPRVTSPVPIADPAAST